MKTLTGYYEPIEVERETRARGRSTASLSHAHTRIEEHVSPDIQRDERGAASTRRRDVRPAVAWMTDPSDGVS